MISWLLHIWSESSHVWSKVDCQGDFLLHIKWLLTYPIFFHYMVELLFICIFLMIKSRQFFVLIFYDSVFTIHTIIIFHPYTLNSWLLIAIFIFLCSISKHTIIIMFSSINQLVILARCLSMSLLNQQTTRSRDENKVGLVFSLSIQFSSNVCFVLFVYRW